MAVRWHDETLGSGVYANSSMLLSSGCQEVGSLEGLDVTLGEIDGYGQRSKAKQPPLNYR